MRPVRCRHRRGFSLIELLVVIALLAVLIALLIVAAQPVREAASKVRCANNLRNFAYGMQAHHLVHQQFPTGGWGWNWIGDPDRGTGRDQPGGWGYCILPFVEQDNTRNMGIGEALAQQKATMTQVIIQPISIFNCPSRRNGGPYPTRYSYRVKGEWISPPQVARTDYGANCGHQWLNEYFGGPGSMAEGDDPNWGGWHDTTALTGVLYERSEIKHTDISRGASHTYLIGEKYLNPNNYYNGADGSDNEGQFTGFNNDVYRNTAQPPIRDRKGYSTTMRYGSVHRTGLNMAFCDGSVRFILYTIDPQIHLESGMRN